MCLCGVFEFEYLVDEWGCSEVECGRLRVHEAAHDYEAEDELAQDEEEIHEVEGVLVGELRRLDERHDAERHDEEDREDYEGYQLRELYIHTHNHYTDTLHLQFH